MLANLLQYIPPGEHASVKASIGAFLLKMPPFVPTPEDVTAMHYWSVRAVSNPALAKASLRFLSISCRGFLPKGHSFLLGKKRRAVEAPGLPTEAAVERAYSHLKHIHSHLRNRLSDPSIDALMFIRMNAVPLGIVAR